MLLKIKKVIFTLHVALVETREHLTCINIVLKRRIVVKDPIKCFITGDKMIAADTDAADRPKKDFFKNINRIRFGVRQGHVFLHNLMFIQNLKRPIDAMIAKPIKVKQEKPDAALLANKA